MSNHFISRGKCGALLLAAALTACAGTPDLRQFQQGLPALPSGEFDQRQPAAIEMRHLDGSDAELLSSGAQVVGSELQLDAAAGTPALEWALWLYPTPENEEPLKAVFTLTVDAGSSAWIGAADYDTNRWELAGPFPSAGTAELAGLSFNNVSPGGNLYLLVAAYSGTSVTVSGIDIEIDEQPPATYLISGTVKDIITGLGIQGAEVYLSPGGLQTTTGSGGVYSFTDLLKNTYTLSAIADGYDTAPATHQFLLDANRPGTNFTGTAQSSAITYTNRIKAILDSRCVSCHGPDVQDGGVRLDSYVRGDLNDAYNNAEASLDRMELGDMPPGDPVEPIELMSMQDWIDDWAKAE